MSRLKGKDLLDLARKKKGKKPQFEQNVYFNTRDVGAEGIVLPEQKLALGPLLAPISRATALQGLVVGAVAAVAAPFIKPVTPGDYNMGMPGAVNNGEVRTLMLLSAPSGYPDDGSYTGLGWYHNGWTVGSYTINLGSWYNGTLQVGWDGVTGAFIAGAGAVILDDTGIRILQGQSSPNYITWFDTSPTTDLAILNTYSTGSTPNRNAILAIGAYAESGGSGYAQTVLIATDGALSSAPEIIVNTNAGYPLYYRDSYGGSGTLLYGDAPGYITATNAVLPTLVYNRTIAANSMKDDGFFTVSGTVVLKTTAAASKTMNPILWYFGGTTLFTYVSAGTGATSGDMVVIRYSLRVFNMGATNAQFADIVIHEQTGAGGTGLAAATVKTGFGTYAIDTTALKLMQVYVTPSATNTILSSGAVLMHGPRAKTR